MAAAEARALWQRAINRCFVQEDAKRAPKLASCHSSSSASTKQVDFRSSGALNPQDQSSFKPLNQNHRFSDHSPGSRWWVHIQPEYPNQKELMKDQMRPFEAEINVPVDDFVRLPVKDNSNVQSENDQDSANCNGEKEVKSFTSDNFQEYIELMETRENIGYESSKKLNELSFDIGSPLNLSSDKFESWWRITDKDELASLVAQKSLDYVENCDLPTPQKLQKGKYSYDNPYCLDFDWLSSLDRESQGSYISNLTMQSHGQQRVAARDEQKQYSSKKSFSCSNNTSRLKNKTETKAKGSSESELSKAELLEALRHSQTRAREAEKAIKEACEEKEHLVKLVFKQASQLFAYKQWLQLLQLEALYLQIKKKRNEKDPSMAKLRRKECKVKKGEREKENKCTFGVALGLSLAGAGLLLGWTVGWMLGF